jgi:hypothetical protein
MLGNRIKENLKLKTPKGKNFVRFGRDFDGGYVIIDDLSKDDFLVSMGVFDDVSFEKDTQELVSGVHLYDHTIECLPEKLDNATFFKEKIGNESHYIFNRIPENKDIILKIDIEGSEWDFFRSLSDKEMNRMRQIAIEIHWFIPGGEFGVSDCPIDVIQKINKTHQLVAIHPNNNCRTVIVNKKLIVPQVMELTFLRKNSYDFNDYGSNPTSLFQVNNPELPDIEEYL